jgi:hypothetical protein
LKQILRRLDDAVAHTLFPLLEAHARDADDAEDIQRTRRQNLAVSLAAARELVDLGLAPSFDQLREAVRMDAGL